MHSSPGLCEVSFLNSFSPRLSTENSTVYEGPVAVQRGEKPTGEILPTLLIEALPIRSLRIAWPVL